VRDRFGIFGTVTRFRELSLLLVMILRIPNNLIASGHDFRRYFTVPDLLVGSSAVHSNRTVADERMFRRFGSRG